MKNKIIIALLVIVAFAATSCGSDPANQQGQPANEEVQ